MLSYNHCLKFCWESRGASHSCSQAWSPPSFSLDLGNQEDGFDVPADQFILKHPFEVNPRLGSLASAWSKVYLQHIGVTRVGTTFHEFDTRRKEGNRVIT